MDAELRAALTRIEPRLRLLLPANLYAMLWIDPSTENLVSAFEHLRTTQRILHDYIPKSVSDDLPKPGELRYGWTQGTLMFTDLAGFTPLMEANAKHGRLGADTLLNILNNYFATMIEIISKSGGNLLEFTGDALLARFPESSRNETAQAVRAGLRMQRAMQAFASIEAPTGVFKLGMRIGLHSGRFLGADIGTPHRMEHVLLGSAVQITKRAEGAGVVGRVNLTEAAYEQVKDEFRFEPGDPGYMLVVDDFNENELGDFDLTLGRRRAPQPLLFDRSPMGLITELENVLSMVEPLASYSPLPILNLVVESASHRKLPPNFPELTVMFVNLVGLPESADEALPEEEAPLVDSFSRAFALINAAIEARGGVLKHVTYHLKGSDMLIYFGFPNAHINDTERAARAALTIRSVITNLKTPKVGGKDVHVHCQIGISRGSVFAAEVGEPRGRREFNILGDTVNIAARIMNRAEHNQILVTEAVRDELAQTENFKLNALGEFELKGKSRSLPVYELISQLEP